MVLETNGVFSNFITTVKKSLAKNNTNLDLPSWFVLFLYGARDGTCKERSDGIAIVARRADRVSHREKVPFAKKKVP